MTEEELLREDMSWICMVVKWMATAVQMLFSHLIQEHCTNHGMNALMELATTRLLSTSQEQRGRFKHKCSHRKIIWDLVASLVRFRDTAGMSINKLHNAHGPSRSVTTVSNALQKDCMNNTVSEQLPV